MTIPQYGFFYPENGERFLSSVKFDSVDAAVAWFVDKRATWEQIPAMGEDAAAFADPRSGAIVVVRRIEEGEQHG